MLKYLFLKLGVEKSNYKVFAELFSIETSYPTGLNFIIFIQLAYLIYKDI